MFFDLPLPLQALVFSFLFPTNYVVKAGFTNVTIDDSDPSISYSSGWSVSDTSDLDYNGTHHFNNEDGVFAEFNFTGR